MQFCCECVICLSKKNSKAQQNLKNIENTKLNGLVAVTCHKNIVKHDTQKAENANMY